MSRVLHALLALLVVACVQRAGAAEPTVPPAPAAFEALNTALGVPLFADDNLWDDPVGNVAKRLGLPQESKTRADCGFRLYPDAKARILGARPYSVSLLGSAEHPTRISIVFANKGDFGGIGLLQSATAQSAGQRNRITAGTRDLVRQLPTAIRADADAVTNALTAVLGPPEKARNTIAGAQSEPVERWKWNDHRFELAVRNDEYAALRILPAADENESVARTRDAALRTELKARIEKRPNGDVLLSDIPMVNQGPKGFCVPATMERTLRYLGIPADMYVLALLANTGAGGGTSVDTMTDSVAATVRSAGRRVEKFPPSLRISNVRRAIDDGLPLLWTIHVDPVLDEALTQRAAQRAAAPTADAWKPTLKNWLKLAKRPVIDRRAGHICLIVGYNAETDELAISDSWGPAYQERWITVDEAETISARDIRMIDF